jgi:hypothetical protein
MRQLLIFFVICSFIFSCSDSNKKTKGKPADSKYSTAFNRSMASMLDNYYDLSEAFVKWDSTSVNLSADRLKQNLKGLEATETKKDSAISSNLRQFGNEFTSDIQKLRSANSLADKRHVFSDASQTLFSFLKDIEYDQGKIYLNECTMPFDDAGRAVWISRSDTLRNPYLGLRHPRYGSGMLECGSNISTIDFSAKDK